MNYSSKDTSSVFFQNNLFEDVRAYRLKRDKNNKDQDISSNNQWNNDDEFSFQKHRTRFLECFIG